MMQEWKHWQMLYNSLVSDYSDHPTKHNNIYDPEIVNNALFYVNEKADYGIYPSKSYMVGIIYATMLNKVYGIDFYTALDDPDLLYHQDPYFVPYSKDKQNYDLILEKLKEIPDWINKGWCPKTVEYFYKECTESGFDSVNQNPNIEH